MNDFRRLAAKLDPHMQLLSSQGINDAHAIINRMMGTCLLATTRPPSAASW